MAVSMAIGKVKDKFKQMRKDITNVVVFVNTLDVYEYLGAANITVQTAFGVDYIKNFLGAQTMILSSEIPAPLRGVGITFIITGLMGIAFMSFLGIKLG